MNKELENFTFSASGNSWIVQSVNFMLTIFLVIFGIGFPLEKVLMGQEFNFVADPILMVICLSYPFWYFFYYLKNTTFQYDLNESKASVMIFKKYWFSKVDIPVSQITKVWYSTLRGTCLINIYFEQDRETKYYSLSFPNCNVELFYFLASVKTNGGEVFFNTMYPRHMTKKLVEKGFDKDIFDD